MNNRLIALVGMLTGAATLLSAQSSPVRPQDTNTLLETLVSEVRDLKTAVNAMRGQLADSRLESEQLKRELDDVRQQISAHRAPDAGAAAGPSGGTPSLADLTEEQQLLNGKLADQYQTKVESGSKYRVRLSGMALFNLSSTRGAVDDIDLPEVARPRLPGDPPGTFGATVRQTTLGLDVFGPVVSGATTSGAVTFDFFGGFPATENGTASGIMRLRTAGVRIDGEKTSLIAGQEELFFSPLSPASLASAAYAPLGSAGNLWTWTPQVYVERRTAIGNRHALILQGGVLDPLSGETSGEYSHQPGPGERSGVPAMAFRAAVRGTTTERPFQIGAATYYSRQNWSAGRNVDAWAAMLDWVVPLGSRFSLFGEAYRGRSIGGLGGSPGGSVLATLPSAPSPLAAIIPLDSAGGWAQLKFRASSRLDFNSAFGEGYSFRSGLGLLLAGRSIAGTPDNRNSSAFVNAIYRVRSNLLFSAEYRRLWTSGFNLPLQRAGHFTLSGGISF